MVNSLALVGIFIVIIGIVLLILSFAAKDSKVETKAAVVGFIGPIPIGFGTDKQTLLIAAIIGIVMLVLSYFFLRNLF